eukprot:1541027-Amphidinium_carterae.1
MAHEVLVMCFVNPEIRATELLITNRNRSDTWCRKPGTAFATEYKIPGVDVRTSMRGCNTMLRHSMIGCKTLFRR